MTLLKASIIGTVCLGFSVIYPQEVLADAVRNKQFLAFDKVQQNAWIGGIVETLWQVAAQKDKVISGCIADWYYTDTPKKNGVILAAMKQYPEHTPTNIVVALTEHECGKYVRA